MPDIKITYTSEDVSRILREHTRTTYNLDVADVKYIILEDEDKEPYLSEVLLTASQ